MAFWMNNAAGHEPDVRASRRCALGELDASASDLPRAPLRSRRRQAATSADDVPLRPDEQHRFLDQTWAAATSSAKPPRDASLFSRIVPGMPSEQASSTAQISAAAGPALGALSALGALGLQTFASSNLPSLEQAQSATKDAAKSIESPHFTNPLNLTEKQYNDWLWEHRTVVTAGTASLISTTSSFPFDSLKSRLQVKHYPSIWACTKAVWQEEGLGGFFRGVTVPLITISFVRTSSFAIYVNTKSWLHNRGYVSDPKKLSHTALSGLAGGATSGVIISCGSAPFELVKVMRQLEYLTAVQKGLVAQSDGKYKARSGFAAAFDVAKYHGGIRGFYIGFPLHMCRDTLGTAFYFGFYDTLRRMVKTRSPDSKTGPYGVPMPVVSFLTGSTAGIASWLFVYPVDLLKTNVQQRTLSNHPKQLNGWQLFQHLMRARPPPDPSKPDTFARRFLRLYRGLGVSALRSFISHGLTWTLIESISHELAERTGHSVDEVMNAR